MIEVTMYKSNDGTVFSNEKDAIKKDYELLLEKDYDNDKLMCSYGWSIEFCDLVTWIKDHKELIIKMLDG